MPEYSYTYRDKTVTICTERVDNTARKIISELLQDSRSVVWKAWVKEKPGVREVASEEGTAVAALKVNIAALYDLIPG